MINQKGNIGLIALLGFGLIVASLFIYFSKRDNLSIEPPRLLTLSVNLNTSEGKKIFHKETYGVTGKKEKEKILSDIGSRLEQNNGFFGGAIISLQENGIYFFSKATKDLQLIPLPEEIKNLKERDFNPLGLQMFAEELSNNFYLVNFSYSQEEHFTYLLNSQSYQLIHLGQFDNECKYIFCGGPEILERLPEDRFIFIQAAGDACWDAGVLHAFDLKSGNIKKLFEYSNGCGKEFDSYFGMYGDSFVRAKHRVLDTASPAGTGPDQLITEIYLTSLDGKNIIIIPPSLMPNGVDYVKLNPESNSLYLYNNNKKKYYRFDLESNLLEVIDERDIVEPKDVKNKQWTEDFNKDYFDYEVMEEAFGDVGKVYKGYQYLKIVNSSDVGANILDESFIDNIVFEREKDQSCIFQRSPKLDGVKYPFKYASREFGDSPRVVSKNEIVFTVVSKCSEYSIKNGKPKEWFLGEKQFLLNTETGEVVLQFESNGSSKEI